MPNKTSFDPQAILRRFQQVAQKLILREIAVRCDRRVVRLDDLCMTCQLAIIRVTMMLIRDGLPVEACIRAVLRNAKLEPHIRTLYHPRDSQRYEQLRQSRAAKIQRDFARQLALCSSCIGDSIHVAHGRLSPKAVVRCLAAEADCLSPLMKYALARRAELDELADQQHHDALFAYVNDRRAFDEVYGPQWLPSELIPEAETVTQLAVAVLAAAKKRLKKA